MARKSRSNSRTSKPPGPKPFVRGGDGRFVKGNAQGPGRGAKPGAPNAGRPRDKIVELAKGGLEKALPLLIETALGEATEKVMDLETGAELPMKKSASANERSKAVEVLGKVARMIGARIEIEGVKDRPLIIHHEVVRKL